MDLFCEQIVKRQRNTSDKIKFFAMFFATVFVGVIVFVASSVYLMPMIGIILGGFVFYIGFHFISNTNCEFEYIITNGTIDIDRIIAGRRRKRLTSTNVKSFSAFGKLDEKSLDGKTTKFNGTIIKASDNIADHTYYADFKHDKFGNTRLIFSPNKKTLEHIQPFISRILKKY